MQEIDWHEDDHEAHIQGPVSLKLFDDVLPDLTTAGHYFASNGMEDYAEIVSNAWQGVRDAMELAARRAQVVREAMADGETGTADRILSFLIDDLRAVASD